MVPVRVQNASFSYGQRSIFKELSFALHRGEIFCLLGPNGCGKTTLLDCILGLHPLDGGSIRIMDRDSISLPHRKRAKAIAYVPQKHERAFPYTVKEMVVMGRASYLHMFAAPSRQDESIAQEALERLGIAHLGDRRYTELSGGETQLVMIARALAQQAPVIVMDEPTAHLDFRHELVILEIISRLVGEDGLTVLMATHFPNHAFYFQNRGVTTTAALLGNAAFLSRGRPDDVIDQEAIRSLYGVDSQVISIDTEKGRNLKQIIPVATVDFN